MTVKICAIGFDKGSAALAVSISVELTLMFHCYWLLLPDLTGQTKMLSKSFTSSFVHASSHLCVYFQAQKPSWKLTAANMEPAGDIKLSCGQKVHSFSNYSFSTKAPIVTKDCWVKQRAASFWIRGTVWWKSSSQEFTLHLQWSNKYTDPTYYFSYYYSYLVSKSQPLWSSIGPGLH